jgi:hypothetical protein
MAHTRVTGPADSSKFLIELTTRGLNVRAPMLVRTDALRTPKRPILLVYKSRAVPGRSQRLIGKIFISL